MIVNLKKKTRTRRIKKIKKPAPDESEKAKKGQKNSAILTPKSQSFRAPLRRFFDSSGAGFWIRRVRVFQLCCAKCVKKITIISGNPGSKNRLRIRVLYKGKTCVFFFFLLIILFSKCGCETAVWLAPKQRFQYYSCEAAFRVAPMQLFGQLRSSFSNGCEE